MTLLMVERKVLVMKCSVVDQHPPIRRLQLGHKNIAVYIGHLIEQPIRELGAQLHKVKLIESPNNSCELLWSQDFSNLATRQLATVA